MGDSRQVFGSQSNETSGINELKHDSLGWCN